MKDNDLINAKHESESEEMKSRAGRVINMRRVFKEAKETLGRLEQATGEGASGDVTLMLMNAGLYVDMKRFDEMVRKLVELLGGWNDEFVPVDVLLNFHQVRYRWMLLVTNMTKVLDDHIEVCKSVQFNNGYCVATVENSLFVKDVEVDFMEKTMEMVLKMMIMLRNRVGRDYGELDKVFARTVQLEMLWLNKKICDYVTGYARETRNSEEKRLKMQAQKMKRERCEKLSDKHWSEVLECEERVMELASNGELVSATDGQYDEYDVWLRNTMEENNALIKEMMQIWTDDELFDMEQLSWSRYNIINLLTEENIELFARLVLRGNIIRSKMNEELKRKFEVWIGDEEKKEDKEKEEKRDAKGCEENMSEEGINGVLRSKCAMKEWRKLQGKGWIDDNLQPTTNMQFAAVIASLLGEKLKMKPKWAAFESLWNMKGLATKLTRALSGGSGKRYCDFQKEVEKALGMSHKRD